MKNIILTFTLLTGFVFNTGICDEEIGLNELGTVGKYLLRGIENVLKDKNVDCAFELWEGKSMISERLERLRKDFREAGATSVTRVGFEFELVYRRNGEPVYYLRTLVCTDGNRVSFFYIQGRNETSLLGRPLDEYSTEGNKFFQDAARSLIAILKENNYEKIALEKEFMKHITSPRLVEKINKESVRTEKELPIICSTISSLNADEVYLRIDDIAFFAQDNEGSVKGVIRGEWETSEGKTMIRIDRFRKMSD